MAGRTRTPTDVLLAEAERHLQTGAWRDSTGCTSAVTSRCRRTSRDALRQLEDLSSPIGAFVRDRCPGRPLRSRSSGTIKLSHGTWRRRPGPSFTKVQARPAAPRPAFLRGTCARRCPKSGSRGYEKATSATRLLLVDILNKEWTVARPPLTGCHVSPMVRGPGQASRDDILGGQVVEVRMVRGHWHCICPSVLEVFKGTRAARARRWSPGSQRDRVRRECCQRRTGWGLGDE